MILANYLIKNDQIETIEISGHANYDESGRDIVCAAVSTAIIVTANAGELLEKNSTYSLIIDEGYFKLDVKQHDPIMDKLLDNLKYTLYDLEQQYPNYIKNQKEG